MFHNINEIRRANRRHGGHWFEPETLRFFRSRVLPTVYGGRYFVTSEARGFGGERRRGYTVREAENDGEIGTVGRFLQHATRADAIRAIRALLADE